MLVAALAPFPVGLLEWHQNEPVTTVVTKLTLELGDMAATLAARQEPLKLEEAGAQGTLERPCDFVPGKAFVDLLVVGKTYTAQPARALAAGLGVDSFYKRFGTVSSTPATEVALVPQATRLDPWGLQVPHGVGPRSLTHGATGGYVSSRGVLQRPLPDPFDLRAFNVAPVDQLIETISARSTLVLDGLLPGGHRRVLRLPGLEPRIAMVTRAPGAPARELALRCDTLLIDTERRVATLTYRGKLPREASAASLVVTLAHEGTVVPWDRMAGEIASAAFVHAATPEGQPSQAHHDERGAQAPVRRVAARTLVQSDADLDDEVKTGFLDPSKIRAALPFLSASPPPSPASQPRAGLDLGAGAEPSRHGAAGHGDEEESHTAFFDPSKLKASLPFAPSAQPRGAPRLDLPSPPSSQPQPTSRRGARTLVLPESPFDAGPSSRAAASTLPFVRREVPAPPAEAREASVDDSATEDPPTIRPPPPPPAAARPEVAARAGFANLGEEATGAVDMASLLAQQSARRALPFGASGGASEPEPARPPPLGVIPVAPPSMRGLGMGGEGLGRGLGPPPSMGAPPPPSYAAPAPPSFAASSPLSYGAPPPVPAPPPPAQPLPAPPALTAPARSEGALRATPGPAADAGDASFDPVGSVERYAAIKAAVWKPGVNLAEALTGFGLDEGAWEQVEARMRGALDDEAKQGKSELAKAVRSAIRKALAGGPAKAAGARG
jgi:hypothetical protein